MKVLDQQPTQPPAGSASLSGLHVLVVDDEDSVRNAVADLLRAKGASAWKRQAPRKRCKSSSTKAYEVALVDIQMPGADGYELARRLKARYPECETRLIAMSAFGLAEEHGCLFDAYVAKPSKADTMVSTIIQTLARRGTAAARTAGVGGSGGRSGAAERDVELRAKGAPDSDVSRP